MTVGFDSDQFRDEKYHISIMSINKTVSRSESSKIGIYNNFDDRSNDVRHLICVCRASLVDEQIALDGDIIFTILNKKHTICETFPLVSAAAEMSNNCCLINKMLASLSEPPLNKGNTDLIDLPV